MSTKTHTRKIQNRPLTKLKAHPSQEELFGDVSDVELQELADDMQRNKQQVPIEILPDGTIICGHQRVRAARLLGWTHIRCWIRADLAEQGEEAIQARLIEDNLHRRQLSDLDIARIYREMKSLKENGYNFYFAGDFRDYVAERFGLCGKTLDRFLQMLDAPVEVQRAYSQRQLSQKQVLNVVRLDPAEQEELVNRISKGEEPSDAVNSYFKRLGSNYVSPETAVFRISRELENAKRDLDGRVDDIDGTKVELQLVTLEKGEKFLRSFRSKLAKKVERDRRLFDNLHDDEEE